MDYNCQGGTDCCTQANCCEQASCELSFNLNAKSICFPTLNCESISNFNSRFLSKQYFSVSSWQFLLLFELMIFYSFQLTIFFFWESLPPCRCWLCLLWQGCPLLWSSLVLPLSVYTQLLLTFWLRREPVYSFPSSVSFPFAPHFLSEMGSLYIPSHVIILILVNIWILFSKLPTIY